MTKGRKETMKAVDVLPDNSVFSIVGIGSSTSLFMCVYYAMNDSWHDAFVCLCVSSLLMVLFSLHIGFVIGRKHSNDNDE